MNDDILRILDGAAAPGVYRLPGRMRLDTAALAAAAESMGWRFFHLDGAQIDSKAEFLDACAGVMGFPGYFGRNWDALEDSARDLSWAPAVRGYVVLYDQARRFAAAQPAEFAMALAILQSAAASWRATPTPMYVLVHGGGRAAAWLPRFPAAA